VDKTADWRRNVHHRIVQWAQDIVQCRGASGRIALMKKNAAGGKNQRCEWLDMQPSSARMDAVQEPQHTVLFFYYEIRKNPVLIELS